MNTCHFGGEIKADSSTDIAWDGGTSYQDNSIGKMHKVQERRYATPYSFENRDCYLILLTLTPERLQKLKIVQTESNQVYLNCRSAAYLIKRCGERSEEGAEGGAYR